MPKANDDLRPSAAPKPLDELSPALTAPDDPKAALDKAQAKKEPGRRYAVRLHASHPTGSYNRDGKQFSSTQDVYLDELPDVIRDDPWLMVAEVQGDAEPVYSVDARQGKAEGRRR